MRSAFLHTSSRFLGAPQWKLLVGSTPCSCNTLLSDVTDVVRLAGGRSPRPVALGLTGCTPFPISILVEQGVHEHEGRRLLFFMFLHVCSALFEVLASISSHGKADTHASSDSISHS